MAKVDPPCDHEVHRCQSCGVGLARWRRQWICSWCKGDPAHGSDHYFNDMIDDALATYAAGLPRAIVRDMLLSERKS